MAAQPCPRLYGGVWHFSRCAACRHVTITHPPLAAAGAGRGRVLLPPKQWAVRHYHSVLVSGAAEGAPDCKERTGPSPHQRWPLKPLGGSLAYLHTSPWRCSPDKKALIEKAVDTLKEKKEATAASVSSLQEQKPSLAVQVKEVILQYYHGFRLLALDSRVAFRLLRKTVRGNNLTRRELKLFRRTVADLFRIVPFSVFIIIPFMEFLLPVYIYLFPNALPSTFQSSSSKAARKKNELKVKLQMAKFLQDTVEEMAVTGKKNKREAVREFAEFFEKIRVSGDQASTEDIIRFSKLFEDELTLDNLTTPTLKALCRLLLLQPIGSSNFLRFQLRMKLRQLMADDDMIQREGVDSLNVAELQAASQARGMRALGIPEERLRSQLAQWLDLHLSQQVPSSLLLLSRALYLPEEVDALQATLSTLPQPIVEEVEVRVADSSGETVDNKTRLDVIRQQEELIREEAREKEKAKEEMEAAAVAEASRLASEQMEDKAPIISSSSPPVAVSPSPSPSPLPQPDALESITVEEIRNLSEVVTTLKGDRLLEDEIQELKDEREEHREDVAELAEECAKVHEELSESKGSALLGKKVDVMISKLDETLRALEKGYVVEEGGEGALQEMQKDKCDEITCTELEAALVALKQTSGEAKVRSLVSQLDPDHDGNINLQEVAVVIESLAHEDTDIKPEHIALIKELIEREGHHGNKEQKNAIS